jgi:2-dehydro-3-deoxygluconokinase
MRRDGRVGPPLLFTAGELMVERHVRHPDHLGVGGAAANAALAFKSAGGRAVLACRLAEDEHLPLLRGELERVGLWTPSVVLGGPFNAVYTIGGDCPYSRFGYTREGSAGGGLGPDDLDEEVIAEADVVLVSGIFTCLNGTTRAAVDRLLRLTGTGALVAYDVNHRSALATRARARAIYDELSPRFFLVKADLDEARLIWGDGEPLEVALRGAARHPCVLVTLGEEGLLFVKNEEPTTVAGSAVETVDATGAGDAALGTLLYHLALGHPPALGALRAAKAGARCVRHLGAWGYTRDVSY